MSRLSRRRVAVGAAASVAALAGVFAVAPAARAASHSDAPLTKLDPQTNITDVYAFIGKRGTAEVLNVIVQVHPFCEPGDGVIYDKFSDDARYSIHITDPNTGATLRRYDFQFSGPSAGLKNPNTVLSYGLGTAAGPIMNDTDATRNYTQTYSLSRTVGSGATIVIGSNLITPPPNVGKNTTPNYNDPTTGFAKSGATTASGLDNYTRDAIKTLSTGETVFAGSRDDGFYCDIPGIFDLLDKRIISNTLGNGLGQDGNGVDGFKGFNVLSYAIQIPVSQLPAVQYSPVFGGSFGISATTTGVGVYASVSRPRITLRSSTGAPVSAGEWIQVNRMGNPFFNEGLVALKDKDNFNRDTPLSDSAKYATYAQNCELAFLINFAIFGSANPDTGPLAVHGRADLVAVFIPEVLRVSTNTDPVHLAGAAGFNRLGFIGGDVTTGGSTLSSGWPNGRRLGDDVADIALTAIASGPTYATVTLVGDNVASNDIPYNQVFPYSATPHSGAMNRKDPL